MGLLDYIKANTPRATTPRVSPSTVIREGLLNPNQFNAPAANRFKDSLFGLAGVVPGVGDIASGVEAADYWNRGEKGNAGLAALGMLPFVPALGGMIKKIPSGLLGTKVITQDGEPLLTYHGSNRAFSEFSNDAKQRHDVGVFGKGHYFSNEPDMASYYAGEKEGAVIYPAYLDIKNPASELDVKKLRTANGRYVEGEALTKRLKRKGYDGVIANSDEGDVEYVVFDPKQIKSFFEE